MKSARPTPAEERWLEVGSQLRLTRTPEMAERIGGWVRVKPITRCALFALGLFAASFTSGLLALLRFPGHFLLVGLVLVAIGEWLVREKRFFAAGIDEAFELSGAAMIAFQLVSQTADGMSARNIFVVAVMLGLVGFRFLNPLFTTLSAVAAFFFVDSLATHHLAEPTMAANVSAIFGFAVACAALAIGSFQFKRPSSDHILDWLVVVMPIAGYFRIAEHHAAALGLVVPFGIVVMLVGIRRRTHAPLIASLVCLGCLAYEMRNLTGMSLQMRLIVWGTAALFLSLSLERYLRAPRRGITSSRLEKDSALTDLFQLSGAAQLATQPGPHAQGAQADGTAFKGGGGTYGGGGASGSF